MNSPRPLSSVFLSSSVPEPRSPGLKKNAKLSERARGGYYHHVFAFWHFLLPASLTTARKHDGASQAASTAQDVHWWHAITQRVGLTQCAMQQKSYSKAAHQYQAQER